MSIRQLLSVVGQAGLTGVLSVEKSLRVSVRIVDAREVYGRTDYLCEPISGSGQQWVSAERVAVHSDGNDPFNSPSHKDLGNFEKNSAIGFQYT